MNEQQSVTVSVVSHQQGNLVGKLLADMAVHATPVNVLLTCNVAEAENAPIKTCGLQDLRRFDNRRPRGYGANNNAAFQHCTQPFFAVLNPDVRLPVDPFPTLMACLDDPGVGVVAPRVLSPTGQVEDSARYFPTPVNLLTRQLGFSDRHYPVTNTAPQAVDWVAGMFMLFRAEAFAAVGGFDDDFFLYYDDVDICARLWSAGWKVLLHPGISVVHAAQHASHRHPRYTIWHARSMLRYFSKHLGRLPDISRESRYEKNSDMNIF